MIPRPNTWSEYIGQRPIVERLAVMTAAAKGRGEPLDHLLICGPPGLGKTTLANLAANDMQAQFSSPVNGAALTCGEQLEEMLCQLTEGAVFFVDEVHRMNMRVVELLYTALEDFRIDLVQDFGGESRAVSLTLPRFTFIGATTRAGLLPAPLRRRFRATFTLEFYTADDLYRIVEQAEPHLGVVLEAEARVEVASRAAGTPNTALTLLSRLRDYHQLNGSDAPMTAKDCRAALRHMGVLPGGLESGHLQVLRLLAGVPAKRAGLNQIAAVMGEDRGVIEEMIEPLLLRQQLIGRHNNGRFITDGGLTYLRVLEETGWIK